MLPFFPRTSSLGSDKVATNPATHLAVRGNDDDLGELAQEGIAGVDQVGVGVALEVRLRLLPELLGGWAACV